MRCGVRDDETAVSGTTRPPAPGLRLCIIGGLTVWRDGQLLPAREVGSRKARTLLAVLAVRSPKFVGVDLLTEALWPENPPRRPAQEMATLVSRLRASLGKDVAEGGRTGYRLGSHAWVDLWDADDLLQKARAQANGGEPAESLKTLRGALALLDKGSVLDGFPEASWLARANMHHLLLLQQTRRATAETALRIGDLPFARDVAEQAAYDDPFDEVDVRLLMRVHAAAGEIGRALMVYERLRDRLATELGADPAHETRQLHLQLLRLGAAPAPATSATRAPILDGLTCAMDHNIIWADAVRWAAADG